MRHVGFWFPDQGWNLHPLQWKCRVLTTGPPGNSFISFYEDTCDLTLPIVLYSGFFVKIFVVTLPCS